MLSDVLGIALRIERVSETAFREQVPGGSTNQLDDMLTVTGHPPASELVVTDTGQSVTGGDPVLLREWVERHAEELSPGAA